MRRFKKILRGASAVLLAAGMLTGSVAATTASAATLQTTTDATLPDEHVYRMNAFSAETSDLTYDSNWNKSNGNIIMPKQNGATITWRNAGTWLDTDDVEHKIDARITVVNYGGNMAGVNNPSTDAPSRGIKGWYPKLLSQTKKANVTLRVDLYYDNNGQLGKAVPSTFKGVTGFTWVPYVRGGNSESVISLDSGFTGIGNDLTSDTHTRLVAKDTQYGNNAFKVTDNPSYRSNSEFIDETYFSAAFSGPSIQFTMINLPVSNATNLSGFLVGYRRAVLLNRFYDVDNGKQVGTSTPSSISLLVGSVPQGKLQLYEPEYVFQNASSLAHLRANYDFVEKDITSTFYNMFSVTTDGTNITATVPSDTDTSQPIYLRSYLKKKRTVTYNANGGTGSMTDTKTGEPVAASTFTRKGYRFVGWNTRADGTGQSVNAGDIASFTADTTLYAQWQVASHTVTFDTNGGNAIASQTVDDKGKAKEPTAPTRDSWTFAGWYLNGVEYDFTTPVTQDITLKAGWKRVAPSMEFKDMHKRISAGSKSGQQKLTLDVKGTEETNTSTLTSTTMWNTVISDPLSEWVDPVGLVDGKGTGITVSKDGKPIDSGYTAVYDGSSRTVKVSLPDSLTDGSVYSVSFEVALSDKARLNYMQSGTYPDTGDADTGTTSAGKKGYSTNGNATLSWDAVTSTNGTPLIVSHKAKYAKPVASYDSSNVPPVLTNKLPGTGGVASLMPVFIGAGLALALAAAWIVRKHLARLP
ncbi:InlB B-repeat-containing protein [Bifidobacterium catenulatum]|uniref:InlB B-repeat-containing protein n=1 Tax=Bifidobacterium catenulatum TaxID=1686 RepID=UPI0034A2B8C4